MVLNFRALRSQTKCCYMGNCPMVLWALPVWRSPNLKCGLSSFSLSRRCEWQQSLANIRPWHTNCLQPVPSQKSVTASIAWSPQSSDCQSEIARPSVFKWDYVRAVRHLAAVTDLPRLGMWTATEVVRECSGSPAPTSQQLCWWRQVSRFSAASVKQILKWSRAQVKESKQQACFLSLTNRCGYVY